MITKYAVFNPLNGQYTKVNTKEEANSVIVSNIIDFYNAQSHLHIISEIQVNENGDETWISNNNGTELPKEYLAQIELAIK